MARSTYEATACGACREQFKAPFKEAFELVDGERGAGLFTLMWASLHSKSVWGKANQEAWMHQKATHHSSSLHRGSSSNRLSELKGFQSQWVNRNLLPSWEKPKCYSISGFPKNHNEIMFWTPSLMALWWCVALPSLFNILDNFLLRPWKLLLVTMATVTTQTQWILDVYNKICIKTQWHTWFKTFVAFDLVLLLL